MITGFLLIIWAHFIGDFILQSDYHAQNKSKSSLVLAEHVLIYSIPFLFIFGYSLDKAIPWIICNVAAHFVVDFITSRITSKLWAAKKVHWFFVTIGADQALHLSCLALSYYYIIT